MTPERWQQVKGVLEQALALAPEERSAFLDRSCPPDPSLRQEVETLLSSSDEVRSSFLESSTLHVTLAPGTKLGDYEVQKLLGSGGMGEVYRARDLRLRRDVAIKVLPSVLSSDKERLRRFEQEAQAAAALNHPNILAVFQMGTYEGSPYLVSELLEGETLREEIKRGPLPARKVIEQGVQIAHGLAAAHEKGIVHRDLKPENLFTTKDGRIKILDFGLAKLKQPRPDRQHSSPTVGGDTEPGVVMGTAGYMSPEQVRGKPADHRTDIFAFGAILYEMLTGRRAFHKTTAAETMSAILNEEPPTVSQLARNIPPALQRTIHRCLEKNSEQRFQSASDLAFALEALSDSTASPFLPVLPRVTTPRRYAAILAAATMIVLGALLVWWWMPTPVPRVQAVRQLTDDGEPKVGNALLTDGLRVYFTEGSVFNAGLRQVSVNGGDVVALPIRFKDTALWAMVSDGSALLLNATGGTWLQPLPAGEPKLLGTGDTDGANFLPDGNIIYTQGPTLFVADKDGTNPHPLATVSGHAVGPIASPDGKRIRFTLGEDRGLYSIWEVNRDGTGLHQIFKRSSDSTGEQAGGWTQDGSYFLYQVEHRGRWDLWALPEKGSLFHRSLAPVQLTSGPLSYEQPIPSHNGNEIFAVGSKKHGELVRYEAKSRQFVPYLSGISAVETRGSRDGKWVVYVTYPEHILWRCRPDGSNRQQLTFPPMMAYYPEISPDGTKIAFTAAMPDSLVDIYIVSMEGGIPEKVVDWGHAPAWSPDGNSLAFGTLVPGTHVFQKGRWIEIHTIDLRTKQVTVLPSSVNLYAPWWPRPGVIVAENFDDAYFYSFDLKTQKWTRIANEGFYMNWTASPDGKFLYVLTGGSGDAKVQRIRSDDFKIEDVAKVGDVRLVNDDTLQQASLNAWIGVAADGSPTLTRDVGSDEVYALDVKWP
jgi:eukaryotic-like serine/threonine-protein kinase